MLAENLARVRERISLACERCRRDPRSVTLIGVTKTVEAAQVREAIALGVAELGENRVQEAVGKAEALAQLALPEGRRVRWHLIGHLQTNKIRPAVRLFETIHSVDSARLAEALDREAAAQGRRIDVFLQVNVSGEAAKFGCAPGDAAGLAERLAGCGHLRLRGLMTIPPAGDAAQARPYFRMLRELRDALHQQLHAGGRSAGEAPLQLSMGMSEDFEVAIEEGADVIRVGTAIFGERG